MQEPLTKRALACRCPHSDHKVNPLRCVPREARGLWLGLASQLHHQRQAMSPAPVSRKQNANGWVRLAASAASTTAALFGSCTRLAVNVVVRGMARQHPQRLPRHCQPRNCCLRLRQRLHLHLRRRSPRQYLLAIVEIEFALCNRQPPSSSRSRRHHRCLPSLRCSRLHRQRGRRLLHAWITRVEKREGKARCWGVTGADRIGAAEVHQ